MKRWGTPNEDPSDSIHPDEWLTHFQTLLNDDRNTSQSMIDELVKFEGEPAFSELDYTIKDSEINNALNKMNVTASPVVDKIPTTLLCQAKGILMPLYNLILNRIFTNATYPKMWRENFLKTIFKKGDNSDTDNYRGIAVGIARDPLEVRRRARP